MYQITVKIEGMACAMCEAHICDTVRNAFPKAKKVAASRKRGEATFLYDGAVLPEAVKTAIDKTGYRFVSVSAEPYQKRKLFGR